MLGWQEIREEFFETLERENIYDLLRDHYPWEVLKKLKNYLLDTLPELPRSIPTERPLPETLFLTVEGEVIPLTELTLEGGRAFFKGDEVKGALLYAGAIIVGRRIFFEEGVILEPTAYVEAPAYFSKHTQIRHGAYVRGSVYTGVGAVIGHTTEVKNSILLSGAKAAHFAYVGDSILGAQVNLGAGTKLANLKFLKKEITFEIKGFRFSTGLKKMGAILGDRVQTGCNAVLQPGSLFGKESLIYPGVTAPSGYFPPKTKLKA
uniref:Mannose-1-phosphate guanyltransferase C-terminal domain-containing protein n=1 Tax=Caldimicrobium thiodismutans TaxID=1653476 RepID=A0A832LX92_9BACT